MFMEVTLAQKADIEGILALQTQIYRVASVASNAVSILEDLLVSSNCTVLVAKINGLVVGSGFIFYIQVPAHGAPYALLEGIVVDGKHRGHGVGTKLLEESIALAKQKGCYKVIFTSGLDRGEAHEFYEKHGFKKQGFEFRMDLSQDGKSK